MDYLLNLLQKNKIYIKFGISGTTATSVDLILLYILHGVFNFGLIISSSIAFTVAFSVSFYLQKFWTFRNDDTQKIPKQLSLYLIVGSTNLFLNGLIIHAAVRKFHIYYLFAQVLSTILLSIWSFVVNKFIIFKIENRRERKLRKKFGERNKPRFFILINSSDLSQFKPSCDCEYHGIVFGDNGISNILPNFYLITKSKYKFVNFVKIIYQTRRWIYWSDKVKSFSLGEIALPGYIVAKLAGKKFVLQTKHKGKPKGWHRRIIRGTDEIIPS